MVKTKNFEQALETVAKESTFEHAYVLHRLGRNKEAFDVLKKGGNTDSVKVRHLLSQVVSRFFGPYVLL